MTATNGPATEVRARRLAEVADHIRVGRVWLADIPALADTAETLHRVGRVVDQIVHHSDTYEALLDQLMVRVLDSVSSINLFLRNPWHDSAQIKDARKAHKNLTSAMDLFRCHDDSEVSS